MTLLKEICFGSKVGGFKVTGRHLEETRFIR